MRCEELVCSWDSLLISVISKSVNYEVVRYTKR